MWFKSNYSCQLIFLSTLSKCSYDDFLNVNIKLLIPIVSYNVFYCSQYISLSYCHYEKFKRFVLANAILLLSIWYNLTLTVCHCILFQDMFYISPPKVVWYLQGAGDAVLSCCVGVHWSIVCPDCQCSETDSQV